MHAMSAPGDSCILTGFASGDIGLWIPPYPTRAGSAYTLAQKFKAHEPGGKMVLMDGTQSYGGVRSLRLRYRFDRGGAVASTEVLSGGADGYVCRWVVGGREGPVSGTCSGFKRP